MIEILKKNIAFALLISCLFSGLLHQEFMTLDIQGSHLWRQSTTMLNVRNFARNDANILNPRTANYNSGDNLNRYEFPVMQWTIGMAQRVIGEDIVYVRLFMFLISCVGMIGFYMLMLLITKSKIVSWITASLFQFSPVIFQYAINPLPDVLALSLSIWYMYFILLYRDTSRAKHLFYASLFLGFATLVKLPFLLFSIVSITIFFRSLIKQKKLVKSHAIYVVVQSLALFPALLWYSWVIPHWVGNPVTKSVFSSDANWSQLNDYLIYHAEIMFPKRLFHVPF